MTGWTVSDQFTSTKNDILEKLSNLRARLQHAEQQVPLSSLSVILEEEPRAGGEQSIESAKSFIEEDIFWPSDLDFHQEYASEEQEEHRGGREEEQVEEREEQEEQTQPLPSASSDHIHQQDVQKNIQLAGSSDLQCADVALKGETILQNAPMPALLALFAIQEDTAPAGQTPNDGQSPAQASLLRVMPNLVQVDLSISPNSISQNATASQRTGLSVWMRRIRPHISFQRLSGRTFRQVSPDQPP